MINRLPVRVDRSVVVLLSIWVLCGAIGEFYRIAWGTGDWLGEFALSWFLALLFFVFFCIVCLLGLSITLWQPQNLERTEALLNTFRANLGIVRWPVAILLLAAPVYILQYTFWGIVLHGPYLRMVLVTFVALIMSWLLSKPADVFIAWPILLVSMILMTAIVSLFAPLVRVTSYPFSLGWSEGNRLWDYSILFGRDLYIYPADQVIPVYLDIGRQFVGGIPFLFSGVNIWQARLWTALVDIVPYLILGWVTFRLPKQNISYSFLAGIWAFTFVRQGPIHPPLLICAIVVAFAWGRPLWLAVPLVFAAGYVAEVSRFTWLFAPAIWSVMLEFAGSYKLSKDVWLRALAVGIAGIFGGYVVPFHISTIIGWLRSPAGIGNTSASPAFIVLGIVIAAILLLALSYSVRSNHWRLKEWQKTPVILSLIVLLIIGSVLMARFGGGSGLLSVIESSLTSQPLLWNRLFPNETYSPGILLGIIIATLPLVMVLIYLVITHRWQLDVWQKTAVALPLLAFLIVGLIVSLKIGGGGDLHNLDMFILGLLFAAAIAWRHGGYAWIQNGNNMPAWVSGAVIAMIVLPVFKPLTEMRPLSVDKDIQFVVTLADIVPNDPLPNPLPDTLPTEEDTEWALEKTRRAVLTAASTGEILFMDQRQLLTFGYIQYVPLVPEYDKKVLIDQAMSANTMYFEHFYDDLAKHRFSLIITSPLNRQLNAEEENFGDENNAWVKWVTKPLLCYYEPLDVLKKVDVEFLVPRAGIQDCTNVMP